MGTLTEESYLIALSLLLAPLQQSIPLRASVLSGQCWQRVLSLLSVTETEEKHKQSVLGHFPYQKGNRLQVHLIYLMSKEKPSWAGLWKKNKKIKNKHKKGIKKHEIKITDKNGNRQCFLSANVSTLETHQRWISGSTCGTLSGCGLWEWWRRLGRRRTERVGRRQHSSPSGKMTKTPPRLTCPS